MRKRKAEGNRPICSVEQAINATNWDKRSTWEALGNKSSIRPWPEGKLSGIKKPKK